MDSKTFKKMVLEKFSTDLPATSRLFEGVRVESGHEKLECLTSVEWPELSMNVVDFIAGEYWQLSNIWTKYYLPSVMLLTAKAELEINEHGELSDKLDSLTTICFSYWCDLDNFQHNRFEISQNVFFGLTSKQIYLIKYWLNNIEFKTLDEAYKLPENFDHSSKALDAYVKKMHEFSI